MPEAYLDVVALKPGVEHSFMTLVRFCPGNKSRCWPSIATLASRAGYSDRTMERHLDIMDSLHIVKRIRRAHTTDLYILPHKLKVNFQEAIRAAVENLPAHANARLNAKQWLIIIKAEKLAKRISRQEYREMVAELRAEGSM